MRLAILLVLISLIGFQAEVTAEVHRSESGAGGALILPYWTTTGGGVRFSDTFTGSNDNFQSIRNDSDRATVVKLHWLNEQGELLQSFNLYLAANSVWAGALTQGYTDVGGAQLITHQQYLSEEPHCVLPADVLTGPSDGGYQEMPLDGVRGSLWPSTPPRIPARPT